MTTALPFWHDMPELQGEVPPLTADDLFHIALRQTYSLGHWLDRDDEARTQRLLDEDVARERDALLDEENRRRIERLLSNRPRRLATLNQHQSYWPRTFEQVTPMAEAMDAELAEELADPDTRRCSDTGEPYPEDVDDEARTDHLLAESVQLDLAALEEWVEQRDAADPYCVLVEE